MPEQTVATADAPLVLVSASPRRRWLLGKLALPFEVLPVDIAERPHPGEPPPAFAQRMADEKSAAAVPLRPSAWLLAADTVVALDARSLGKPRDAGEAAAMLRALAGRPHVVFTGVTLRRAGGDVVEQITAATEVAFRTLTDDEIAAYIATGEPFDRAGAYAIQGEGAHLIDRVTGSYTNVVGLPLPEVAAWLRRWVSPAA
jgi:septum formation protein